MMMMKNDHHHHHFDHHYHHNHFDHHYHHNHFYHHHHLIYLPYLRSSAWTRAQQVHPCGEDDRDGIRETSTAV